MKILIVGLGSVGRRHLRNLGKRKQTTLQPAGQADCPVEERLEVIHVRPQHWQHEIDTWSAAAGVRHRLLQAIERCR